MCFHGLIALMVSTRVFISMLVVTFLKLLLGVLRYHVDNLLHPNKLRWGIYVVICFPPSLVYKGMLEIKVPCNLNLSE